MLCSGQFPIGQPARRGLVTLDLRSGRAGCAHGGVADVLALSPLLACYASGMTGTVSDGHPVYSRSETQQTHSSLTLR